MKSKSDDKSMIENLPLDTDLGLTRNYYNLALNTNNDGITNGQPSGNVTVGNPFLKPTQSTNVDASVEWYFAPVGSLTFAAFWKELSDVATNTTARVPFTNNGATFDVLVTTPGSLSLLLARAGAR